VHIDDAADTEVAVIALYAYALAYCKTVELVYAELSKGHVHDGEDCWLDHYGLPIQLSDEVDDIIRALDDGIDRLDRLEGESFYRSRLTRLEDWIQDLRHRLAFRKVCHPNERR
jgi:hypothetical protein